MANWLATASAMPRRLLMPVKGSVRTSVNVIRLALLADFVVGVGDLGGQVERGLEDLLRLAAQLLPTGFLVLVVQFAHPIAELAHAGMVLGQVLPQVPGDLFQLGGHQLRATQFPPRAEGRIIAGGLRTPAENVADRGHDGQGHRDRNLECPKSITPGSF